MPRAPVCFALLLAAVSAARPLEAAERAGARFEPPAGKVLLIVGQSVEDIASYEKGATVVPAGYMTYTSVNLADGLTEPADFGGGTHHAQAIVDRYPTAVLQIGLYMVDQCAGVIEGRFDEPLDRIGTWIRGARRPVFLRVGYEFDGPHNHYSPKDYVAAYRYIVDRFRRSGVKNVAFVWHSYASTVSRPLTDWYPGDDYVDWFGISYFRQPQRQMLPMVGLAKAHQKPVMICEASPWFVQTKYANAWPLWFAPLFSFIADHNIQALSYINSDWDALPMFKDQHWGDTRLEANPDILRRWLEETSKDRYLHASPELFQQLEGEGTVRLISLSPRNTAFK